MERGWAIALLVALGCNEAEVGSSPAVPPSPFGGCAPAAADICNGQDDDCDGLVDENGACENKCGAAALSGGCAIRHDGRVVCYERGNFALLLGDPALLANVSQLESEFSAACVRHQDGGVFCVQHNDGGEFRRMRSLAFDVAEIAVSMFGACARKFDGTLWCWSQGGLEGFRGYTPKQIQLNGRVARLLTSSELICAGLEDGSLWCAGVLPFQTPPAPTGNDPPWLALPGVSHAAKLALVRQHNLCVLQEDGRVFCFGQNEHGQLGDGTVRDRTRLVFASELGEDNVGIAAWSGETCAHKRDGSIVCVGAPSGIGPRPVADGSAARKLELFGDDVQILGLPCAVKRGGTVWCRELGSEAPPRAIELCSGAEKPL